MKKIRLSSQVRRAFQGSSLGITLIEVLLAIALLGVISVTLMSALGTATNVLITADERTTAESLARRQMEYVKGQGYQAESAVTEPIYPKISGIPVDYSVWSLNRTGGLVEDIVGIPWDSESNKPADKDIGLQKIALVIKHKDKENQIKVVYTFINDNPYWADGAQITLESYKVDR